MLTAARLYREIASSVFLKALQISLILGNPRGNFLRRKLTGRWKLRTLAAQARGKKQEEFLFLLRRQRVSGGLDLGESAHLSYIIDAARLIQEKSAVTVASKVRKVTGLNTLIV